MWLNSLHHNGASEMFRSWSVFLLYSWQRMKRHTPALISIERYRLYIQAVEKHRMVLQSGKVAFFDLLSLFLPAAFRLWGQEILHTESGGHQHPLGAQQQPLQGHSYSEDRGGRLWRTSCFLQTGVPTRSKRERPHQHGHWDRQRQGSGLFCQPCQVRESSNVSINPESCSSVIVHLRLALKWISF